MTRKGRSRNYARFGSNGVNVDLQISRSKFYSPAYSIAQQIQDALNPDSPNNQAHGQVSGADDGVRVPVVRKLEEREKASKWLLPNGYVLWVPSSALLADNGSHIRITHSIAKLKRKIIHLPPIDGMTRVSRERLRHVLRQKRGDSGS